jgi:hypothetical protein
MVVPRKRFRGNGKNRNGLMIGRPPKAPGAIAPEFEALFEDIAHPRKRAYLAAYVQEGGNSVRARKTSGSGGNHSDWLRADPEYAAAFARAKLEVAARAEAMVFRYARSRTNSNARRGDAYLMDVVRRLRRPGYGVGPRWPKK